MSRLTRYTVRVTPADIEKGCQRHSSNCPVARALFRTFELPCSPDESLCPLLVTVRCDLITLWGAHIYGTDYATPHKASLAIRLYDNTGKMRPFSFALEVDETVLSATRKRATEWAEERDRKAKYSHPKL